MKKETHLIICEYVLKFFQLYFWSLYFSLSACNENEYFWNRLVEYINAPKWLKFTTKLLDSSLYDRFAWLKSSELRNSLWKFLHVHIQLKMSPQFVKFIQNENQQKPMLS